ncbi:hypothetical protein CYLTODRAFT_492983 [Cylindrobasidium torrendii FP15055 ss-10]|uniref:Uncharacterized protein n=1 Tax=Cylindrobasidium torrendii FP15055 ss-10 TaxID=1314674 RepID=A0A0D7B4X8_9AGAR|nr:hypothetical protein CYLTODRAFT_492983 [Cylindrobasidium torrendii FP15055 ss-10]
MLFTPFFTLALAAVSLAAPAPSPVELEDRAVTFESIRVGLTVVITSYRSNPSTNNRQNLCRILSGLSQAQKTRLQSLGFDFSRVQCPSIVTQLNAIQSGLGAAYQAYTQNQNAQTTAALCAITSQLSASQRSRIIALGINLNVQCPSITDQLNGIQAGLGAAYQAYTRNPSRQNTAALCAITTQLTAAQQTSVTALGVDLSNVQCTTIADQLNAIQSGLGAAYLAYTQNQNTQTTAALCAITSQLTAAQRSSVAALGVTLNVQCPTLADQLNAIQAGLGQAYQAYTRNPNRRNTAALCTITTQLTAAQQTSVAALNVNLGNVPCAANLDQRLDAIADGLADAYDTLAAAPTVFANQLAYCQITNGLNAQQTARLQALNLSGAANVQCTTVLLQNRLNNNFIAGFGDAYVAYQADPSAANKATLCGLTAQLNNNQRNRLRNNLNIGVTTFGCN